MECLVVDRRSRLERAVIRRDGGLRHRQGREGIPFRPYLVDGPMRAGHREVRVEDVVRPAQLRAVDRIGLRCGQLAHGAVRPNGRIDVLEREDRATGPHDEALLEHMDVPA